MSSKSKKNHAAENDYCVVRPSYYERLRAPFLVVECPKRRRGERIAALPYCMFRGRLLPVDWYQYRRTKRGGLLISTKADCLRRRHGTHQRDGECRARDAIAHTVHVRAKVKVLAKPRKCG
ncbi:hypothetical protein KP509_32G058300 [Ceratopteris richardii]|uniref:Uncharacterized protein n=1 Tax=Ceratopteris richardii TaxID=49495 RepID=A0A8T2QVN3_CERRI|nr:hypothetical protein KP509_32G058300 [Ceratopteris richardii]